jgi:transaldolase
MKLFLDSGDIEEIKKAYGLGVIDGVTSNPKLIAANWNGNNGEFLDALDKLGRKDPVIVTLSSHERDSMIREAQELCALHPKTVIKLYMTEQHLSLIGELKGRGIPCHVSLVYSVNQAFLAAKAGAAIISPFLGRADDFGDDGVRLLTETIDMIRGYGFDTEVMAASIRHPHHAREAIRCGAPIITMPFAVLEKMYRHPATEEGVRGFLDAAGMNT